MQNLLLCDHIETLKILDLHYILEELSAHTHFERNKTKFSPPIKISVMREISKEYDAIDNISNSIIQTNQGKIQGLIKNLSPDLNFSLFIIHFEKEGYLGLI